ncbi:metal-dependent phosphohydrolase [Tumebacillus algifaecis]|uniref:Metal-dependent phosphohydrolase n=1 Tax=Tumebacillus algifaecis TaxID=1214604 RepID=A0A223CYT6_9BACL|nr:HD domain-containing phosphohydrolase [Tumebacillus algifaecis]ASS74303.1 metal-dependent phosphohydrolase [Tumebacillus algifaecis]
MRHVAIDMVQAGNVLARSIYTADGRPLLNTDVQLTVGMISTLRRLGVTMIYIQDKRFQDVVVEEVVSEETRREALGNLSIAVQCIQGGNEFDSKMMSQTTSGIIDELIKNRKVLVNLTDIRTVDNRLFVHSLNVCILSVVVGIAMRFNRAQLSDLAVGALLHDIGKVEVPDTEKKQEESDMPKGLSNDEKHTWRGYKRLRKKNDISIVAAHCALQHHEFIDGSGFPRGLKEEEIHLFARIVAVANEFDNLISGDEDRLPMLPHEATEYLMSLAGKQFDHEVVIQFLRAVAVFPTGMSVRLDTGQIGVVVGQHKGLPTRPVVRVFTKEDGDWDSHNVKEVDLAQETTVFIKKVLQE